MVRIAEYSRDALRDIRQETGISYDHREAGTLQLFRTTKQLASISNNTRILDAYGVPYTVLDAADCIAAEPALARVTGTFVGGLRLPGDETGDAHLFTQRLAALCERKGVVFRYDIRVAALRRDGSVVTEVELARREIVKADAYIVALGSYTPALLRPLGIGIPVYPVKGYSLTLPVADADAAPVSTVMDETYKVAITRLGDRIRVGGTAELAGFSHVLRAPRRETLIRSLQDLFPTGGMSVRRGSGRAFDQ